MLEHLDTVIAFATVMLLLSLLVTTIVQMVITLLGLRGKCLLDGTEQLLKQLDPNLGDQARTIAEKVLRHPAVGTKTAALSGFSEENQGGAPGERQPGLAVAIRPEELILVLKDLMAKDRTIEDRLKDLFTDTPGKGSPEMVAKAEELLKELEGRFPAQAKDLRSAVEDVLGRTQNIVVKVDAWFDTVMDRTSEVFKVYTRKITVAVAILFALLLHVDSLRILDQVSTDKDLRARLVQMSDTAQEDAKKAIELEGSPLAAEAIQGLANDEKQPGVKNAVSAAVSAVCGQMELQSCLRAVKTRQDGETWLNNHVPQEPQPKQATLAAYDKSFTMVTQDHLKKLNASFQTLQSHLGGTELEIIPNPVPWAWHFDGGRNFLGVVMTAFFLSLGAPFWYNALRKLSDLRPIVARRVDGEPLKGAPKQGS